MSEELMFKRRLYHIPDQAVEDVERYLEWIKKHVCKDGEVEQINLDFARYESEEKE